MEGKYMDIEMLRFEDMRRYIRRNDIDCLPRSAQMETVIGMLAHYGVCSFTAEDLILVYRILGMISSVFGKVIVPAKSQIEKICDGMTFKEGLFGTRLSKTGENYEILSANDVWYMEFLASEK